MEKKSLLTPSLRALVGSETKPVSEEVCLQMIQRFAKAVFDPNPSYADPQQDRGGGITAPLPFFQTIGKSLPDEFEGLLPPLELQHIVAGGEEWEFTTPIRTGDVITRQSKLVDVYEKEGRAGMMLFLVTETTYTNQRHEAVVKTRSTVIAY